jgi:serine/threonine protein kinase
MWKEGDPVVITKVGSNFNMKATLKKEWQTEWQSGWKVDVDGIEGEKVFFPQLGEFKKDPDAPPGQFEETAKTAPPNTEPRFEADTEANVLGLADFTHPETFMPIGTFGKLPTMGAGAGGTVYRADTARFGPVAVKVCQQQSFEDEKRLWYPCKHENVLTLMGWSSGSASGGPVGGGFLVAELMDGSLADFVRSGADTTGEYTWRGKGRRIAEDVCRGLRYLHNNLKLYHGDLKLENILVKGAQAKLGDLGFAAKKPGPGKAYKLQGTPGYMSPEILAQTKFPDEGAVIHGPDMFAFGIVLSVLVQQQQSRSFSLFLNKFQYEGVVQFGIL